MCLRGRNFIANFTWIIMFFVLQFWLLEVFFDSEKVLQADVGD